jgi:PAS domain S-box-containing protein
VADAQSSFPAVLAMLVDDPGFREFARGDAALLLWNLDGTRLLWTSPTAAHLREALVEDEEGSVAASLPARPQLRALGQGLAPTSGARLERLRLDGSRLTPPVICACRRVTLPSGEGALLTAIVGPVPKLSRGGAMPGLAAGAAARAEHAKDSPDRDSAGSPSQSHGGATVRFLWHTDASGRFTYCSDALAEVVGSASAAILGLTWDEIEGELVRDPTGAVSKHFAGSKTWSGETVPWRIAGTNCALSVDLAGVPVFGRERQFLGFRGFGLCRTADVSEWEPNRPKDAAAISPRLLQEQVTKSFAPNSGSRLRVVAVDEAARKQSDRAMVSARAAPPAEHRPFPHLSPEERAAFREIARALGARFGGNGEPPDPSRPTAEVVPVHRTQPAHPQTLAVLDGLPVGLLVYRGETPLFANRLLLDLAGYADVHALARDGVSRLFPGRSPSLARSGEDALPLTLSTLRNESLQVDVRLASLQWEGMPAVAMVVRRLPDNDPASRLRGLELDLRASEARLRELASILDTAADGVIVLDEAGRILALNRSAEALFGYDQREVAGESLTVLLASESRDLALDYLDGLRGSGVAGLLNDGREVLGRVRQGGAIPLFMTAGRASETPERKFCVVLRDITALKKAEVELLAAKRAAQEASADKSNFLAKVSHELRTPLNAIIGFAEVMIEERFGPMGNERYKDYLKDIHDSGRRVLGLVNGLLDLAKIEAGRMELSFAGVSLNELVAGCVSALSQSAARERIVIRTSFASNLPPVVADQRSLRESVANIVTNAVKFTGAGGQVIVSTAMTDRGEIVIRVRDTGIGMTSNEIEAALKPLRQLAIARKSGGAGLGLPLAKALVEANRGALRITSAPGEGTLVEIVFPPTRVLAQ